MDCILIASTAFNPKCGQVDDEDLLRRAHRIYAGYYPGCPPFEFMLATLIQRLELACELGLISPDSLLLTPKGHERLTALLTSFILPDLTEPPHEPSTP